MDRQTREVVWQRSGAVCEYCHLGQSMVPAGQFHIEHIRARQHGGGDSPDNLCLACHFCNTKKGTNQSAYDPLTGDLVALFHPRREIWSTHFEERGGWIIGLTAEGRATVALLQMIRDLLVRLRQSASASDG